MAEWRRTGLDDARIRQPECALRHEPSASNHAIRLEPDLADAEISGSAVTANALLLLRRAAETGGLKLTATGNLSRAVVEEMFGIIQAPDYDKTELLRFQKVINEPDLLPLHFVRILTQTAKLIRTHRGKLLPTPLGRRMLAAEQHGPLQALLFHVAFWHNKLAYFDRRPIDSWPQSDVGVVLWSLSASANDWLPRETLTRLCTIPVNGVLEGAVRQSGRQAEGARHPFPDDRASADNRRNWGRRAGASAYAGAIGIEPEAFLARFGAPMAPRQFGDHLVAVLDDPQYATGFAFGLKGDTGITVLEGEAA
jgi:hypothetical protein